LNNTDTLPGAIRIVSEEHDKQLGLHPEDTLWINFDMPIKSIDTSYIQVIAKSSSKDTLPGDTLSLNLFKKEGIQMQAGSFYNWTPDAFCEIEIFPGAITDFWGRTNDTMDYNFTIAKVEDFGKIQLQFQDFDSSFYFVQVMDKEKVVKKFSFQGPSSKAVFSRFKPTTYSLQIIADTNQNQKWDPGHYLEHRQSEVIHRTVLKELRPDWTLEQSISLPELKKSKVTPPNEEGATPSGRGR